MNHDPQPQQLRPDIPAYFVRVVGGPDDQPPANQPETIIDIRDWLPDALLIYGYAIVSPYPEDTRRCADAWRQSRLFLAQNYSVMCPDGEPGMVPADVVNPISREDFEAARERDWR